ncbi:MAG: Gfo/Idh/MocA family oxidoreductase [Anaerolineaceae bacterium]|nr:Gfo/Idh/MocA family oxidoreductase [Anaerolineaceae bacterium]
MSKLGDKPLRFALIGTGLVADFHAKAIIASPECELVGATDLSAERLRAFAEKYDCQAIASLEELLGRKDIDVVNVLTPNATHSALGVRVAAAGKHCLVEKPPDMTLQKAEALIAAFDASGTKLAVCLNCRFRKALAPIREALEEGRFGTLLAGDVYMKWFRPQDYYHLDAWRSSREHGAGVTVQQAFHYYDLLLHLMGPVRRVWARMENLAHPGVPVEDTTVALLEYANGAHGVMEASTAMYPGSDLRIEINGSKGTAVLVGQHLVKFEFEDTRPEDAEALKIGASQGPTGAGGAAAFQYFEHQWLIEDLCRAIRKGGDPRVTGREARRTLELALAMYDSAETGQWVELKS